MERISIRNFCGIKNVSLELSPISLFIGPQATGKSVAAKLIYYFREAIAGLSSFALAQTEWTAVKRKLGERFASYFAVTEVGAGAFVLRYDKNDAYIQVSRGRASGVSIKLETSDFFENIYAKLLSSAQEPSQSAGEGEEASQPQTATRLRDLFLRLAQPVLGDSCSYEQLFIPAARASLALLPTQFLAQIVGQQDIDVWMPKFAELLNGTRNTMRRLGFYGEAPTFGSKATQTLLTHFRASIQPILRAEMQYDGEAEKLKLDDGRIISLLRASSGQQESLPLLLVLGRFTALHHAQGRSVFIEEPEAHLWPGAQRRIVNLLAEMYHRRKDQVQLVLTTHSPYVLSSFNNLLESGRRYAALEEEAATALKAGAKAKLRSRSRQLEELIPRDRSLPPGSVGAWEFSEGSARHLVDDDFGILGSDLLDAVSDELDSDWNAMQEVGQ